jgi:hypothetical protein
MPLLLLRFDKYIISFLTRQQCTPEPLPDAGAGLAVTLAEGLGLGLGDVSLAATRAAAGEGLGPASADNTAAASVEHGVCWWWGHVSRFDQTMHRCCNGIQQYC